MLLCITIPCYALSHETFGVTSPHPSTQSLKHTFTHTHTQLLFTIPEQNFPGTSQKRRWPMVLNEEEEHSHRLHQISQKIALQSFSNYILTYATTDLLWQPIICSPSLAFFHISCSSFSIPKESSALEKHIKTSRATHSDETSDVMLTFTSTQRVKWIHILLWLVFAKIEVEIGHRIQSCKVLSF